jgi:hypothetical protein
MNDIISLPNFMKIYQVIQKLLVGDRQTDWLFDKPTFIFGKWAKYNKVSIQGTSRYPTRDCRERRRISSSENFLLLNIINKLYVYGKIIQHFKFIAQHA